jgi:hypothetical protein
MNGVWVTFVPTQSIYERAPEFQRAKRRRHTRFAPVSDTNMRLVNVYAAQL